MDENKLFGNNEEPENEEIENNEEILDETEEISADEGEISYEPSEEEDSYEETPGYSEIAHEEPVYGESVLIDEAEKPKKSKAGIIAVIIAAVIVILLGVYLLTSSLGLGFTNKYNRMGYQDISGMTLGEMCEQIGIDLETFKEQYGLPEDMPENTNFNAAYNMMPVKIIAAMNYTDFATLKEEFKIPDTTSPSEPKGFINKIKSLFSKEEPVEITEDTPWGVVQGEISLEYCVGAENLESFKTEYGFGDEITLESKWKEVRPAYEKAIIKERIAAEKEAEKEQNESETPQEDEQNTDAADTESTADSSTENTAGSSAENTQSEE